MVILFVPPKGLTVTLPFVSQNDHLICPTKVSSCLSLKLVPENAHPIFPQKDTAYYDSFIIP